MSRTTQRYNNKRDQIIAEARTLISERMIDAVTFADVAAELGIHTSTIYHYFGSIDKMRAEVMLDTCRIRRELIAAAQGTTALDRLLDYLYKDIACRDLIRLLRVELLSARQRNRVEKAIEANIDVLQQLIEAGIRDGSIRSCDSGLTARTVHDVAERLSTHLDPNIAEINQSTSETAEAVVAVIRDGLLPEAETRLPSIDHFKRFPDLSFALSADDRLEIILKEIVTSVSRYGVPATSIPKVAASLGMTKTTIYRYAEDKEELLYLCLLRNSRLLFAVTTTISAMTDQPLEALLLLTWYSSVIDRSDSGPLTHGGFLPHLTIQHQRVISHEQSRHRATMAAWAKRASERGLMREIDSNVVQVLFYTLMRMTRLYADLRTLPGRDRGFDAIMSTILLGLAPRRS
ncbi:MAG: TetR/AcrR family transcriptional regulator [Pseudomonadota bacterium]